MVAKQLLVETIRDVSNSESETSSVSLGVSVNWAGQFAPSVSVSASDSMQNSELVHFISGISGADVKVVAQEIKLKGAEIFGTEKLNVQGVVTTEDVEVTCESSSSHMGFSFDPIKGQGLTSINFGIGEKHDNGVVHSGVGTEASHESTDKGGYTLSLLGNNVLVRGFKEAYNWLTEPTPANDVTPPAPQESEMNEKEKPEEKQPEEKSEPKAEKEAKKKEEKTEAKIASKAYAESYTSDREKISHEVDKLEISTAEKKELKVAMHKLVDELYQATPSERKEMIADLRAGKYKPEQEKHEPKGWLSTLWSETFGAKEANANPVAAVAVVSTCLSNPACSALVVGTAIMVYNKILTEVQKGTIISTPIHEQTKPDTTGFPEHKEESTDRGFTPWDGSEYKDKGFTPVDVDTKIPGFEMPDSIDTSILMNENYDEAMAGGKHSAWAKQYVDKPDREIEKGIRSLDKQIELHKDKIANPEKHNPGWEEFHPSRQESLMKRWPKDIKRQEEQKDILESILKERR